MALIASLFIICFMIIEMAAWLFLSPEIHLLYMTISASSLTNIVGGK
jgi:hypothetical protein